MSRARGVVILGTSSGVGKSLITSAICRWLCLRNREPTPFKPMSMAAAGNRLYRTNSGAEIHIHQAHQALAARLEPNTDMNPIVFREVDRHLQILMSGTPADDLIGLPPNERLAPMRTLISQAYLRLAGKHQWIVVEGCGGPVELNIKDRDVSNLWIAEMCDSPCILVGSAERTGVFAAIVGTLALLPEQERSRILGFVINKFHGDSASFADGVHILEEKTNLRCFGVLPFLDGLRLLCADSNDAVAAAESGGSQELEREIERWTEHVAAHLDLDILERCMLDGHRHWPIDSSGDGTLDADRPEMKTDAESARRKNCCST